MPIQVLGSRINYKLTFPNYSVERWRLFLKMEKGRAEIDTEDKLALPTSYNNKQQDVTCTYLVALHEHKINSKLQTLNVIDETSYTETFHFKFVSCRRLFQLR